MTSTRAMTPAGKRPTLLAIGLAAIAFLLVACEAYDPAVEQQLQAVKTNSATVFAQLQTPAPNCTYAASKAAFAAVDGDLTQLKTAADPKTHEKTGPLAVRLADSWQSFEQAAAAGGDACLPVSIVADKQKSFTAAVDQFLAAERALKGKGGS